MSDDPKIPALQGDIYEGRIESHETQRAPGSKPGCNFLEEPGQLVPIRSVIRIRQKQDLVGRWVVSRCR
jgi:hypothetical protein